MNIEYLRAKLASYDKAEHALTIVIDHEQANAIREADATLAALREERSNLLRLLDAGVEVDTHQRLTDATPTGRVDERIAHAEQVLAAAKDAARDSSLVLVFRRTLKAVGPDSLEAVRAKHIHDGKLDTEAMADDLMGRSFVAVEDADGQPTGLTLDEVRDAITLMDIGEMRSAMVNLYFAGAAFSFDLRSSGAPATN